MLLSTKQEIYFVEESCLFLSKCLAEIKKNIRPTVSINYLEIVGLDYFHTLLIDSIFSHINFNRSTLFEFFLNGIELKNVKNNPLLCVSDCLTIRCFIKKDYFCGYYCQSYKLMPSGSVCLVDDDFLNLISNGCMEGVWSGSIGAMLSSYNIRDFIKLYNLNFNGEIEVLDLPTYSKAGYRFERRMLLLYERFEEFSLSKGAFLSSGRVIEISSFGSRVL